MSSETVNQSTDSEPTDLPDPDLAEGLPHDLFSVLTERQAEVMVMKLGLDGEEPMSSPQVASRLGISDSTVRGITASAQQNIGRVIENITLETLDHAPLEHIPPPPHPWQPIIDQLLIYEIELLDLMTRDFSDIRIGRELGIGGGWEARRLRSDVAQKFGVSVRDLPEIAPKILKLAGEWVDK